MQVDLKGKSAIVTGSTSGIGMAIALMLARNGADIVVNSHVEDGADSVVAEIEAIGRRAIFVRADVGDATQAKTLADKSFEAFGSVDILVNNAGINVPMEKRGPVHRFLDDMWRRIMNVNLDGVYNCSKAALQYMTSKGSGKIVNISSIVGVVPLRNQCAFAAAKAGVINLTKAMAIEMASFGINVNAILPGSIDIPAMRTPIGMYADGRYESILSHIPMKRAGRPEDIANGVLYLASAEADYVTGSILVIDGGWTCGFARDW